MRGAKGDTKEKEKRGLYMQWHRLHCGQITNGCQARQMCYDLTSTSKCAFCSMCRTKSKLLLRSLEWRPGEGKLDAAMTHSAFQSFPPSKDLGTGLSTDTCGRCQIQQHGSIKK